MSTQSANVAGKERSGFSEGGANPMVKMNSDIAEARSEMKDIPWLLAKMYASSPIVNMDQTRGEGIGMVPRLYLPVAEASDTPRTFGQKLQQWFARGEWK